MTESEFEVIDVDGLANAPADTVDDEAIRGICTRCDTRWIGERICHCSVCHLTFTSIGPFDFHQKWNYRTEPAQLHCMTPDELREAGYEPNGNGHWRKPTDNRWFDDKDGDD